MLEPLRPRVKDLDFDRRGLTVREGKGDKDRVTMMPAAVEGLRRQLEAARWVHQRDVAEGYGRVWIPNALARKYPHADREWGWQ